MHDAAGIGDIATGGIVTREVDRAGIAHGIAGDDDHSGGACLNCGAVRAGPFCQRCGQSGHVHRNLTGLGHDLLHGVFHFEGRFWHTLPMLAWRPGELTRRYVHGERVRFVTPMALFLFSVFLLFAAVNQLNVTGFADVQNGMVRARAEMAKAAKDSADNIAALQAKRTAKLAADPHADVAKLDRDIAEERNDLAAMAGAAHRLHFADATAASQPAGHGLVEGDANGVHSDIPWLDRALRGLNENSALYAYKIKMASYKYSWALIPISIPFIWLLFCWRRDIGLYDHAIFAIHSLSFMTLMVVAMIALYAIGVPGGWLWLALLVVPPVHIYRHLKGAYLLGRGGALWRTAALLTMTLVTTSLFGLLLIWLETD